MIYVNGQEAGKVHPQMARVSPADVKKEEYGYIIGTVEWVSNFAASSGRHEGEAEERPARAVVQREGPGLRSARVPHLRCRQQANGLKWSSSTGPAKPIEQRRRCGASVVVDHRKPYTYVIPSIKRTLGV